MTRAHRFSKRAQMTIGFTNVFEAPRDFYLAALSRYVLGDAGAW